MGSVLTSKEVGKSFLIRDKGSFIQLFLSIARLTSPEFLTCYNL